MAGLHRDVVAARRVVGMDVGSSGASEEGMRGAIEWLGNAVVGYGAGGSLAVAAPVSSSKGSGGFQE